MTNDMKEFVAAQKHLKNAEQTIAAYRGLREVADALVTRAESSGASQQEARSIVVDAARDLIMDFDDKELFRPRSIMKLYWCSTADRSKGWFMVARNVKQAVHLHDAADGVDPRDLKAKAVAEIPDLWRDMCMHCKTPWTPEFREYYEHGSLKNNLCPVCGKCVIGRPSVELIAACGGRVTEEGTVILDGREHVKATRRSVREIEGENERLKAKIREWARAIRNVQRAVERNENRELNLGEAWVLIKEAVAFEITQ